MTHRSILTGAILALALGASVMAGADGSITLAISM